MASIRLDQLTVQFNDHFSLIDIDWSIQDGEHWALLGPNGSGKSALAAAINGAGETISGDRIKPNMRIAVVSFEEQEALIEEERKKDDADLLDIIAEGTTARQLLDQTCADPAMQNEFAEAFNFTHLLDHGFRKLSSGESRKLLLIRALSSKPELLLLDEPFEGLDADSLAFLTTTLNELASEIQMVMVLNRFDEIPDFITHIGYVDKGQLTHQVATEDRNAVADLGQLLHLKTTDLSIPEAVVDYRAPTLDSTEPLVKIQNGKVAYGDKVIFQDLNWTITPGEHWQVTGPNGSGKTCLLNLITGDHPQCYVNDIFVFGMQRGNGESIWDIKQHIGYVSSALQWEYRVSVSVRNAIISGFYDSIGIYQKYTDVQRHTADAWLRLLDMESYADKPFSQLSFGDQRLVLIARAMVKHPPLLILDEPCLGLDDLNRQLILALIEIICAGSETTVLYVNHRPQDAIQGIEQHLAMQANTE